MDHFWITNPSDRFINLSDLGVYMRPHTAINLLDKKHYKISEEQIFASLATGSLSTKPVVIRVSPPKPSEPEPITESKLPFPTRKRSAIEIENVHYEELNVSDDTFAEENADLAEIDHLGKWGSKNAR
jgi:hypothetical protein